MKNFVQKGDTVTVAAPYDLAAGQGALVGALFGVAQNAALTGTDCELIRKGIFALKKTSAQAWATGAKLYWDNAAREVTTVANANTLIGVATAAAANPSAAGDVLLDGAVR
jgi:predicted RecA/RadA family phage recombinase